MLQFRFFINSNFIINFYLLIAYFKILPIIVELKMSLPDFMTNPNAVLNDTNHKWRYNIIPDYSKANAAFDEGELQFMI